MSDVKETAERISTERLVAMLAGLEGVTPGDWVPWVAPSGQQFVRTTYTDSHGRRCTAWTAECAAGGQNNEINAAHIARCDPDTMRAILTELLASRHADAQEGGEVGFVEVGTFIAASEHGVGVKWGDLGPLGSGDKLYALSVNPQSGSDTP